MGTKKYPVTSIIIKPPGHNKISIKYFLLFHCSTFSLKEAREVFKLSKPKLYIFLLAIILIISGCTNRLSSVQGEIEVSLQNFIRERIKLCSAKHFTQLERCEVVFTGEKGVVQVDFRPDFGAIIFKNDIWRSAAAHTMNLIYIFPEIKEYNYGVFDNKNNKLMDLLIDEMGIKALPEKFYGTRGPGDYRNCFTKVEFTKIGNELPLDEDFYDGSQLP